MPNASRATTIDCQVQWTSACPVLDLRGLCLAVISFQNRRAQRAKAVASGRLASMRQYQVSDHMPIHTHREDFCISLCVIEL